MKVRAIATNTLAGLVRSRIILLFVVLFACVVLLMTAPLMMAKAMSGGQGRSPVMLLVGVILTMVSGFGSLLAAWASADALASEMKSGTVLAVMARPIRRWEFLLGKYLGVQLLMGIYVLFVVVLTYLLSWMGGERLASAPWMLIVYPLVRYALYSAIALFLATMVHPVLALGGVLLLSALASMLRLAGGNHFLPEWLRATLHYVLPSTGLLSETRFLAAKSTPLHAIPWSDHLVALTYGLDWALVFFLLAVWVFQRTSLNRA